MTVFIDPYVSRVPLRSLLLRRTAMPDEALIDRYAAASGEVAGVLVGHTHFDHAVDAPAIARRHGANAYGSASLGHLMRLHGLGGLAVEVTPHQPYELGPFVVRFVPSRHSKLLFGRKVPMAGELTCDHLDGLAPGAYRCGTTTTSSHRSDGRRTSSSASTSPACPARWRRWRPTRSWRRCRGSTRRGETEGQLQGRLQGASPWSPPSRARRLRRMRIRTHHGLLAAAVAVGAVVVPAMAQDAQDLPATRIVSSAKATPNRAGTPKHPQGMKITASARLIVPSDVEAPIVTGIEVLTGKGITWTYGKYVKCSKQTLDRQGPKGCPRTSIMGSAIATGNADTVATHVDLLFVNGGPGTTYIYATLNNPARIRETLVLTTTPLSSSEWGQRETVSIPRSLQIVGGVPLQLTAIKFTVGGKSYAKEFIANTSCPRGGWKYQVTVHYLYESLGGRTSEDVSTGSIPCTK